MTTSSLSEGFLTVQRRALKIWHDAAPKAKESIKVNIPLGFISFGGPAVHFQIFRQLFVDKKAWIEQPMFEELFGVTQALSGPASTKMLYCINLHHSGFLLAVLSFFTWSLPGAIAMYGLSLGVARIGQVLPAPVYALLTGLNAATVGIVVLAAVQLSQKVITDPFTRAIVFLGASAGMLYNALWYFPLLMILAGTSTFVWDSKHLQRGTQSIKAYIQRRSSGNSAGSTALRQPVGGEELEAPDLSLESNLVVEDNSSSHTGTGRAIPPDRRTIVPLKEGCFVIAAFFTSFIIVMVLHKTIQDRPFLFSLFRNFYLAGTIIFGGGPVVIPLLRDYIVTEGWVSPRDFLLGLALIQAFPGPNFNFAVFLGSLAAINASRPSAIGALIGFIGIFAPGLILVHGTMGIWSQLRSRRWFKSCLRGVNAAAVGLIFSAVYRLWQIGFIDEEYTGGSSLGRDPWWVVVAASSYVGSQWFSIPVPLAILLGGVMGFIWYGVTS